MKTKSAKQLNKKVLIIIPILIILILAVYFISVSKSTPIITSSLNYKQKITDNGKNLILYAFSEDPMKRKTVFKSDINASRVSKVNVNYDSYGNDRFLSTKDGKYVAKWTPKTIEVASVKNINVFNKIVDLAGKRDSIEQVKWSNDGTKLLYSTYWLNSTIPPYSPPVDSLYIINTDGAGQRLIKELDRTVAVQGMNLNKDEIYWFETGPEGGGFYNFTIADIITGKTKNIDKFCGYCASGNSSIAFSSNFERAYFRNTDDGSLTEYNLVTKESKVLFKEGRTPQGTNEEGYFESTLLLSPNEDFLIADYIFKASAKTLFYLIPLSGAKEKLLSFDPNNLNYTDQPESLSPDGRYVFFTHQCQNQMVKNCGDQSGSYIIDLQDNKTKLFNDNKNLVFLTWLTQ